MSTAPKLEDANTANTVRYFDQLHRTAIMELELRNVKGTLPPKAPVALSSKYRPWWWQSPCQKLISVFLSRYSNESDVVQGSVDDRMVVDLAFATYYATRWKLTVATLIHDGLESISTFQNIFNMPTGILIEWVMREQRHITLYDGEVKRHEALNDGERPPRVSADLLRWRCPHCDKEEPEPKLYARDWDPELDALFKFKTVRRGGMNKTTALPFAEQENWTFHIPEPGSKGHTSCPHTDLTPCLDGHLNKWVDNFRLDEERDLLGQPSSRPDTVAENIDALVLDGLPAIYYSPALYPKDGVDGVATPGYLKAGPGFSRPFPGALTRFADRNAPPGTKFTRIQAADPTSPDPCLLMFAPHNLPIANIVKAEPADREAMADGCSQGCAGVAIIRYRSSDDPVIYLCPFTFCTYNSTDLGAVHHHMDNGCSRKPEYWRRPQSAKEQNLPPLSSKGCGHTLCTMCLAVSILIAPPLAICPVCYTVAKTIRMAKPGIIHPVPDVPELWRSTSFHDHLEDRFRQVRHAKLITVGSWMDKMYLVDEVDRPPLENATRQRNAKSAADASIRDDADESKARIKSLEEQLAASDALLRKTDHDLHVAKVEASVHERNCEKLREDILQLRYQAAPQLALPNPSLQAVASLLDALRTGVQPAGVQPLATPLLTTPAISSSTPQSTATLPNFFPVTPKGPTCPTPGRTETSPTEGAPSTDSGKKDPTTGKEGDSNNKEN